MAIAIAINRACLATLEANHLYDDVIAGEFEELLANVATQMTGKPHSATKNFKCLSVFREEQQETGFSLVAMISRSSPVYSVYPAFEDRIRDEALEYFQNQGVDFTFQCQVVVLDRRH